MSKDLFAFVADHVEVCPYCTAGAFCAKGRALMDLAVAIGVKLESPIPPIPRSPWKA